MVTSMIVNGATGFAMLLALLFCLGDIKEAVTSPTGYPFIDILVSGVGSIAGGTALVSYYSKELAIFIDRSSLL